MLAILQVLECLLCYGFLSVCYVTGTSVCYVTGTSVCYVTGTSVCYDTGTHVFAMLRILQCLLFYGLFSVCYVTGTRVFANLWSTYHDEEVYPDSYTFKPDRFLDENGELVKQNGKVMLPFSVGKRQCLGDGLAKAELFMFLVSIMQRFTFTRLTSDKLSEEGVDIFTRTPVPYQFVLSARK